MSGFNGSGTFVISGSGLPFVTATTISSTVVNQLDTDLATGLSTAICKDGQTTVTANIPLAGFKLTGVGAATMANDALTYGTGTNSSTLLVPTRQVLTSGSGATYTTPTGVRQLRIRMVGGGSGGSRVNASATPGGNGGFSSFDNAGTNYKANGATGASSAAGGGVSNSGGSGGTGGTSPTTIRYRGAQGSQGSSTRGGTGASSFLGGGGGYNGTAGLANTGAGGGGEDGSDGGAGGSAGEYVEIIINSPSATYTYTVGAGGTAAGAAGAGGTGIIIVDEIY